MNPQESQEEQHPPQPIDPPYVQSMAPESRKKTKKRLALILIIAPTVFFVLAILIGTLSNLLFDVPIGDDGTAQVSISQTILNIITYVLFLITFITWLPGLIIGIILLTKQSK
jgi:Na+/proline symporter